MTAAAAIDLPDDQQEDAGTANLPALRDDVERIVRDRAAALASVDEALASMQVAHAAGQALQEACARATRGAAFYARNDRDRPAWSAVVPKEPDPEQVRRCYREHIDAGIWTHLLNHLGVRDLMDAEAVASFEDSLTKEPPEATAENIIATFETLLADRHLIFQRGLANAFGKLDRRFKSHDAFRLGSRIIIERFITDMGNVGWNSWARAAIHDVERVFAVLDGQAPDGRGLIGKIDRERRGEWGPSQSKHEARYFRINCFKNGNAHLWFTRDDLVEEANRLLADYYGAVLPDAVEPEETRGDGGLHRSRDVAADLAFYWTPEEAARLLVHGDDRRHTGHHFKPGQRVLEPSAGEGHLVRQLIGHGLSVHAVEVSADRHHKLRRYAGDGVTAEQANFLEVEPRPVFDHVVMNPPFSGRHWMKHVRHAFEFLAPGGRLSAILPASAEIKEDREHLAFRRWASQNPARRWDHRQWEELPAESFSEAGTRINTVILRLGRSA